MKLGVCSQEEATIYMDRISHVSEVKGGEGERQKESERKSMRESAHLVEVSKGTPVIP